MSYTTKMRGCYAAVTALSSTMFLFSWAEGQHIVANATTEEILFSSPGYIDDLNYGPNTTRDYRFQTYHHVHTLLLKVVEFELEHGDKNNNCLYDKVVIYDGFDDQAPTLETLCDNIAAGTTYSTTGDTVYVVFKSDHSNNFKGFQMSVVSDGPVPPTTTFRTLTSQSVLTTTSHLPTTTYIGSTQIPTSTYSSRNPTSQQLTTITPGTSSTTSKLVTISSPESSFTSIPSTPTLSSSATSEQSTTSDTVSTGTQATTAIAHTRSTGGSTTIKVSNATKATMSSANTHPPTVPSVSSNPTLTSRTVSIRTTTAKTHSTVMTTPGSNESEKGFTKWVIIGACTLGLILIITTAVVLYRLFKKKTSATKPRVIVPCPNHVSHDNVGKTSFKNGVTKSGFTASDSSISVMDLPSPKSKANVLPPLRV